MPLPFLGSQKPRPLLNLKKKFVEKDVVQNVNQTPPDFEQYQTP